MCIFFFLTVFQFLKILDLAWPLSIQPQRTLLFRPWRRTIHVWPLGAVRGCHRYTVIVLCSDQHWLLHAVSSLSSLTVGEKRMLFRDKSTSLTINYTHVFPAVFSAFFQMAWSSEFSHFFDFCKWDVLLPLNYGAACPQNRFCKCRAQDDNGGLKCDASMVVSWREKQHLSWLPLTAHDNMWWITHAGLSKRTAAGLLGRPDRQSETAKIFWVSWRDKILEWRRSKSRCGNAQTNNRARPHEVNIRSHMQKSLVCWHMQTHTAQRNTCT